MDYAFARKDVVKRVVTIEGLVEAQSPLRVGVGRANMDPTSIARDAVLKDGEGRPVIPGSSWKGVFRSTGEKILGKKGLEYCSGIGKDNCLERRRLSDRFQRLMRDDVGEALRLFWENTCLNCKVFGTMSVIGAVRFLDSVAVKYSIGTRTMIAISRTEGAVARGAFVQVEYVEPGSTFTFKLIGTNLPNYAIGYLVSIMKEIHDGLVQIGGHKSRGFGFVKFKELKFTSRGEKKVGDEDVLVDKESVEAKEGDEFFEEMKPFVEAFNNARIPYPKK